MMKTCRLSICMMVKDEEKNLNRCLDALKPLLSKPDVELIIVDTGSTDNTVSIASQYTSHIYSHAWNNNFAGMRNITISYAKGERILILDADEVLLDAEELYELIIDKRLSSYSVYLLNIKNLLSTKGQYTVLPQERVFLNDGYFKYTGVVHNQPQYRGSILKTDIYVEHYGYMFHDRELAEKKFIRTGGILKEQIKKDPGNSYYRFQLAKSYIAHNDYKEALDEIRVAYRLISGKNDLMKLQSYIYGAYAVICCRNYEFSEAVDICREGISVRPDYLDLYYTMGEALKILGNRAGALDAYKGYVDLVFRYNELLISSDKALEIFYLGEAYRDNALNYIASEYCNSGLYDEAYLYVNKIQNEKVKRVFLLKIWIRQKKLDKVKRCLCENTDQAENEILIKIIEEEKVSLSNNQKKELELLLSEGEDLYSLLNRYRISADDDRQALALKALRIGNFNELPEYYAELFLDIDKIPRQCFSVMKTMSKSMIRQYVRWLIDHKNEFDTFLREYLLSESIRSEDYQSLRLYISIAYVLLINLTVVNRDEGKEISDEYFSLFKSYIDYGLKYIDHLYNPERLRLYYNTLDDHEDRFFIALRFALQYAENKDNRTSSRYFLEAAREIPLFAVYMKRYKDEIYPNTEEKTEGI